MNDNLEIEYIYTDDSTNARNDVENDFYFLPKTLFINKDYRKLNLCKLQ